MPEKRFNDQIRVALSHISKAKEIGGDEKEDWRVLHVLDYTEYWLETILDDEGFIKDMGKS